MKRLDIFIQSFFITNQHLEFGVSNNKLKLQTLPASKYS